MCLEGWAVCLEKIVIRDIREPMREKRIRDDWLGGINLLLSEKFNRV